MRRNKSKKSPSRPHPSQRPSRLDSRGHIMTAEEQKKEWARKGLCVQCGIIQISRKTSLFGMKREALTIPGKVYKGICLQCNTLQYAMAQSGEVAPVDTIERTPHRSIADTNITSSQDRIRQMSTMEDTSPMRTHQRGMSREQNDAIDGMNDTHEHGVPRDVGPRMGGLQKQVSEITLDSAMLDLDVEPRTSLSDRNFNTSLGSIVEDESSHNRDATQAPSSSNYHGQSSGSRVAQSSISRVGHSSDSRVGVFSLEGGAMERLEARIRAKSDSNSHHVHFNGPAKKPVAKYQLSNSLSNSDRSGSGIKTSRKMNDSLESSKADESIYESSGPGTAVNMIGDRLNIYEERIRQKNAQSSSNEVSTDRTGNVLLGEGSGSCDRKREEQGVQDLVAQDSSPGDAIKIASDRLNVYEERIRRKEANSSIVKPSHTFRQRSDFLSRSEHSDESDGGVKRLNTEGSKTEHSRSGSGEYSRRMNHRPYRSLVDEHIQSDHASHERSASEMLLPTSSDEGYSRSNTLTSVNEGASTPGVTKVQGDFLNLYERRINQKSKQISQSTNEKRSFEGDQKISHQDGSHSTREKTNATRMETSDMTDKNFQRSRTNASEVGNTTGLFYHDSSDRTNLYERRIREKEASRHASISQDSTSSDQQSTPGIFQEYTDTGRQNVFEQRMRQKRADHGENRSTSMSTSNEGQVAKTSKESSQNSSNLGVKRSDSRYDMILQRKISRGNSESHRKHHGYDSSVGVECESNDEMRSQLCEIKNSGNCDDIVAFLRQHSDSLPFATAVFAFQCIIDVLIKNMDVSDNPHLFRSKVSWLKPFSSLMYTHFSNEIVQAKALEALWSIASYSMRHATDIITNDEIMESIVDGMECHQSEPVSEFGSGLIWCLATGEKSSSLLEHCDGQIVQRLVAVLTSSSYTGASQLYATRALFCLSTVFLNNCDGFFGDIMGQCISDERVEDCDSAKAICVVLDALHQHSTHLPLLTEGSKLLCQLLIRDTMSDNGVFFAIVEGVLNHVEAMCSIRSRDLALDAALVYLLSHISTYCSDTIDNNFPFSKEVLAVMSVHSQSESVAFYGCRFVYNICACDSAESNIRQVIGDSGGIKLILDCLTNFDKHIDILGEACGAIFACSCNCPPNKALVADLGGVMIISTHVFNAEKASLCSDEDGMLSLNIRACAALITLAVNPFALQEMQRLGIIKRFESCLEDDSLDIRGSLRSEMEELVSLSLRDDACFDDNMSENETHKCLFVNLKAVLASKIDLKSILLLQANTIDKMRTFPENEDIQELGCKILASTFGMGKKNVNGLEVSLSCITGRNASIIATAASVFRNFCLAPSAAEIESYESCRLHDLLLRSVDKLIGALRIHISDDAVVEQVTSALWAISTTEPRSIISFESTEFIHQLLGFINGHASIEIKHSCLGILHMLFSSTEKTMDFLTDDLILAVIKCLQFDDENVATMAITTIYSITEKGAFPARMMILNNHHELLIGAVVESMFKFPRSPLVIRAACDIFSNMSLDNYYRSTISNMGGTGRINDSLLEFRDEKTICKALISLTNLISGCDADVLRLTNVANNIVQVIQIFKEDLYVQVHGASAIWHLASRDDLFKDILVDIGAVKCLTNAMTRFICSEKMMRKGVVALWSLSVPCHLKTKVAQDGFASVVNGMSAHVSSEQACEEGLGALKSMSTAVKQMAESNDALDLVYSCMWLHSHTPSIQEACLAALINLSVDMEKNQVSQISFQDLETIVEVMRIHQNVKAVQENAIILLKNFTFSPHNCQVLQGNIYLASLIRMAMINFHDTFQGRAENLLRVLPSDSQ